MEFSGLALFHDKSQTSMTLPTELLFFNFLLTITKVQEAFVVTWACASHYQVFVMDKSLSGNLFCMLVLLYIIKHRCFDAPVLKFYSIKYVFHCVCIVFLQALIINILRVVVLLRSFLCLIKQMRQPFSEFLPAYNWENPFNF